MKKLSIIILILLLLPTFDVFAFNYTFEPPEEIEEVVPVIIQLKEEPLVPFIKKLGKGPKILGKIGSFEFLKPEESILATQIQLQDARITASHLAVKDFLVSKGFPVKRTFRYIFNGITANVSRKAMEDIKKLPEVENVFLDKKVKITLSESVPLIGADEVWQLRDKLNRSITGENITIAILDTGIDYTHPDLGGCTQAGFLAGNCSKVIGGWDFVNQDSDPMDDHGHGTHCAGIAAGNGTLKGVAPEARLLAYKVLDEYGAGYWSWVISGIEQAVKDGADIISMSLGGPGDPDDPVSQAVDEAVDAGVVVVVAAGNSGPLYETLGSPGVARKAITVGASDKSDTLAGFSSRGPTSIGTIKPDILAPGVNICSARWDEAWKGEECIDDKHVEISGTSMATPHVAGLVALIKQMHPDWTPDEIKMVLRSTAVDLGYPYPDQGWGRVDATTAVLSERPCIALFDTYGFKGWVKENFEIKGTATCPDNFTHYEIYLGKDYDFENRTLIYSSDKPVINGTLAFLNTTGLEDGTYLLKLEIKRGNRTFSDLLRFVVIHNYTVCRSCAECEIKANLLGENQTLNIESDLTQKEAICIQVRKNDIRIDCKNHTILGPKGLSYGIQLDSVKNVEIDNCNFRDLYRGVWLKFSENVKLRNNTFDGYPFRICWIVRDPPLTLKHDIDESNRVNGSPILYFYNISDKVFTNEDIASAGCLMLANSKNVTFKDIRISEEVPIPPFTPFFNIKFSDKIRFENVTTENRLIYLSYNKNVNLNHSNLLVSVKQTNFSAENSELRLYIRRLVDSRITRNNLSFIFLKNPGPNLNIRFNRIDYVSLCIYNQEDINLSYNYWGTTNCSEIEKRISDSKDGFGTGRVIYNPVLVDPYGAEAVNCTETLPPSFYLEIWDDTDKMKKYPNEPVYFYARPILNGSIVKNATCWIDFPELRSGGMMGWYPEYGFYRYRMEFPKAMNYTWKVTCYTATDNATASDYAIIYQPKEYTLDIWDTTDIKQVYANETLDLRFYAKLLHQGKPIGNATCTFNWGGLRNESITQYVEMEYNKTTGLYEYAETVFGQSGTRLWSVRCNLGNTSFSEEDKIEILPNPAYLKIRALGERYPGERIRFQAVYKDMNHTLIKGNCTILVEGNKERMQITDGKIYEFNYSFENPGTYQWQVACQSPFFEGLIEKRNITIEKPLEADLWLRINASDTFYEGKTENITLILGNKGKYDAKDAELRLTYDGTFIGGGRINISSGEQKSVSFPWKPPAPGTYILKACVMAENEYNMSDNCATKEVKVIRYGPDFQPFINYIDKALVNQTRNVTVTVINFGPERGKGYLLLFDFYERERMVDNVTVELEQNEERDIVIPWTPYEIGYHMLIAKIILANDINPENNIHKRGVEVLDNRPDLSLDIVLPDFELNKTSDVLLVIKNLGTRESEKANLSFSIYTPDKEKVLRAHFDLPKIIPGQTYTIKYNFTPKEKGWYSFVGEITCLDDANQYNNFVSRSARIMPPGPDLTGNVYISEPLIVNKTATIGIRISNLGDEKSENASWKLYIIKGPVLYLSENYTSTFEWNNATHRIRLVSAENIKLELDGNEVELEKGEPKTVSNITILATSVFPKGVKLYLGDLILLDSDRISLDAGKNLFLETGWTPSEVGTYGVIFKISDPQDVYLENNLFDLTVNVLPEKPDIRVSIFSPSLAFVNETISIDSYLNNIGGSKAENVSVELRNLNANKTLWSMFLPELESGRWVMNVTKWKAKEKGNTTFSIEAECEDDWNISDNKMNRSLLVLDKMNITLRVVDKNGNYLKNIAFSYMIPSLFYYGPPIYNLTETQVTVPKIEKLTLAFGHLMPNYTLGLLFQDSEIKPNMTLILQEEEADLPTLHKVYEILPDWGYSNLTVIFYAQLKALGFENESMVIYYCENFRNGSCLSGWKASDTHLYGSGYISNVTQAEAIAFGEAPYCGDGICQDGESCSTCPEDCGSCPKPRVRGGTSMFSFTIPNISVPTPTELIFDIDRPDLPLGRITIKVNDQVEGEIHVDPVLPQKPLENAYTYFELETDIPTEKIEKIEIVFRVPKEWVTNNQIDPGSIKLYKLGADWEKVETDLHGETEDFYYYTSTLSSFSVFGISGEKGSFCAPGSKRCYGNLLQECNPEGIWQTIEECVSGCDPLNYKCEVKMVCDPGIFRCFDNTLKKCREDGQGWEVVEVCDEWCEAGECTEKPQPLKQFELMSFLVTLIPVTGAVGGVYAYLYHRRRKRVWEKVYKRAGIPQMPVPPKPKIVKVPERIEEELFNARMQIEKIKGIALDQGDSGTLRIIRKVEGRLNKVESMLKSKNIEMAGKELERALQELSQIFS